MVLTSASVFTTTSNSKTLVYINHKKDGCIIPVQPSLFVYLEVLADALPLGELEFEVLIVEEKRRLTYLTFELPV